MPWPTGNIDATKFDADSDSISASRPELYKIALAVNEMANTGGLAGNASSYTISAETATGGANLRLTSSANVTDDVKFANGSGITITRTDANIITIDTSANISNLVTTNTTQTISGAKTFTALTTLNEYVETVYAAGNQTNYTPNHQNGPVHTLTATGNITLNTPTNMSTGSSIVLIIRQDGTGSRILTANTNYKFSGGLKTLSTAASSIDLIHIFYDGTNYLANLTKGYT